ncbi:MAG TPA: STAS domain-containing protein [Polyangiaceae bacterium]
MKLSGEGYSVDGTPGVAVVRGVLRLESVAAYEAIFTPIRQEMGAAGAYTIDFSGVTLMNSSGIRALANLVLEAKTHDWTLVLKGTLAVPWQRKSLASLGALTPKVKVEIH